ncbi:deoxyguanosinetriphosphate triphosphohydrolase [Methanofollis liminatans DSM 4140]|uniref:Deoxyguanosinetriphosphate triphosphohydrolase n=1 Tax=Methanofollis liminatans DSM 4140 TaxID=28892 RepID=J1AN77_9EURY|nr:HD domain-containing protein [Methanofollis liminatans]EJG06298.1 deoxyguanosinetriphosphate triphosphohydrolase [Methanofollis liminatans DSM 4140]
MDLYPEILAEIRDRQAAVEQTHSPHATRNAEAVRKKASPKRPEEPVIRPPFYRDNDRILHSRAYTRYIDKTQVFFLIDNDHITHRVLHVQLVSKIGRTIGRALGLNEDLIEAIALGHDIGHTPFGHKGEACLDAICRREGIGAFRHNLQSVRFLDVIEDLDLTLQTLDGILCHDGERFVRRLAPAEPITAPAFAAKCERIGSGAEEPVLPSTMEGCVVRAADVIGYLGRDLQDAIEVGLIDRDDEDLAAICRKTLGTDDERAINWTVIDTLIKDLVNESFGKGEIAFSEAAAEGVKKMQQFSIDRIYNNPRLTSQQEKIERMFSTLFDHFSADLEEGKTGSLIYTDYLDSTWVSGDYLDTAGEGDKVRDFIAGMTDRYFFETFQAITLPERVKGTYRRE